MSLTAFVPPFAPVVKRSVLIAGRKTSISLEKGFWHWLRIFAVERGRPLGHVVAEVKAQTESGNLSSSLRQMVLRELVRRQASRPTLRRGLGVEAAIALRARLMAAHPRETHAVGQPKIFDVTTDALTHRFLITLISDYVKGLSAGPGAHPAPGCVDRSPEPRRIPLLRESADTAS